MFRELEVLHQQLLWERNVSFEIMKVGENQQRENLLVIFHKIILSRSFLNFFYQYFRLDKCVRDFCEKFKIIQLNLQKEEIS
jgi:hypothetical protein